MRSDLPSVQERRLHPLTVVFQALGVARQMILPALAGGVSVGQGEMGRIVPIILALLGVPAIIAAVVKYWFFRYALTPDELVIRSGLFSRTHRVIPLARVQNVDVKQGPAQRLFRVAELRVETAGAGSEAEARLAVLGAAEAQSVRAELLARRRAARPETAMAAGGTSIGGIPVDGAPGDGTEAAAIPPGRVLKRLSTVDVILAGATANEAGVIAAALVGAVQVLDDVRIPIIDRLPDPTGWIDRGAAAGTAMLVAVAAGLVLAVIVLGWTISIAGAVVRYHGFTLRRDGGELRKRYGLLTVHEGSVPLERVQAIRVEESALRRALGLASMMIETAGVAPGQGTEQRGAEAFVPLARRAEVAGLVRGIFDDFDLDLATLHLVHPRARLRALRRWALRLWLPCLPLIAAAAWFADPPLPVIGIALVPLLVLPWLLARREYATRGYAATQGYVVARTGVLGRVTWIIPQHKLQTLHLRESPMQRRHGLASLVVDTAAGGRQATIADLAAPDARALLDELAIGLRAATRARRRMRRPAAVPVGAGADLPAAFPATITGEDAAREGG
jgi:putative membrane protein